MVFINSGDTIVYSVVVGNSGSDATGVVFTDQLNANLTLVGAPIASPIAANDTYACIGNVGLTVPAGSGVLVNDINPQGSGTMAITRRSFRHDRTKRLLLARSGWQFQLQPAGRV